MGMPAEGRKTNFQKEVKDTNQAAGREGEHKTEKKFVQVQNNRKWFQNRNPF
jgi:hypothetical protein